MTIVEGVVAYWKANGFLPSNDCLADILGAKRRSIGASVSRAKKRGLLPGYVTRKRTVTTKLVYCDVSANQVRRDRMLFNRVSRELGLK